MNFRVAIGAKQDAFGDFSLDLAFAPVRKRAEVQLEFLGKRIDMMPSERSNVLGVSAVGTLLLMTLQQVQFPAQATLLLADVALVSVVRVGVLAAQRAKPPLPADQRLSANSAIAPAFHPAIIGPGGLTGGDP
jgi:hypothetical protein